jgi:hypothetical protein
MGVVGALEAPVKLSRGVMYWAGALGVVATAAASLVLVRQFPVAWLGGRIVPTSVVSHAASSTVAMPAPALVLTRAGEPPASIEANLVKTVDQRPVFDVVRVEPTGDAVIAGRASPNAIVELRDDGLVLAQANADASGQFVILPPPLSVGGHHLQLAARTSDTTAALSDAVAVNVAAMAKASFQAPSATAALTPPLTQISGVATTEAGKPAGAPPVESIIKDARIAKVVPGDNLWNISQHYFGDGMRYLQIYAANASQVRRPQLIYPGQVLVIPQTPAPKQ